MMSLYLAGNKSQVSRGSAGTNSVQKHLKPTALNRNELIFFQKKTTFSSQFLEQSLVPLVQQAALSNESFRQALYDEKYEAIIEYCKNATPFDSWELVSEKF